jgi:ribonuclease HI
MSQDESELILQFDGGSRGNPGPAGIGLTLRTPDGRLIYELGEFIGKHTNNVAEYTALLRGLEMACKLGVGRLIIRADSELVVRQIQGRYRVKSPDLQPLYQRAIDLLRCVPKWSIEHVYRDDNHRPDELANQAMNRCGKVEHGRDMPA